MSQKGEITQATYYREDEIRNRVPFTASLGVTDLNATPVVLKTVTPGKTLYITDIDIDYYCDNNNEGEIHLRDSGIVKKAFIGKAKPLGANADIYSQNIRTNIPYKFTNNMELVEVNGDMFAAITVRGYEE